MNPRLALLFAVCSLLAPGWVLAQKTPPKPLTATSPGYPEELNDTGLSGVAEVDFVVKADGTVTSVELAMAHHRAFGRAAIAAVKAWRFEPGTVDGGAADVRVTQKFQFTAPFEQQVNALAKRKVFRELPEPAVAEKDFPAKKLKVKRPARPTYPRALMGSNVEEKVQVRLVVAPDGTTLNPRVVGAKHKEFEGPALVAVALMSYEPPTKDGKAVYVETTTTLNFTNERPEFGGGRAGGGRGGGGGGRGGGGDFGGGGFGDPP